MTKNYFFAREFTARLFPSERRIPETKGVAVQDRLVSGSSGCLAVYTGGTKKESRYIINCAVN